MRQVRSIQLEDSGDLGRSYCLTGVLSAATLALAQGNRSRSVRTTASVQGVTSAVDGGVADRYTAHSHVRALPQLRRSQAGLSCARPGPDLPRPLPDNLSPPCGRSEERRVGKG